MLKSRKQLISDEPTRQKPIRFLPGIIIVVLQWLLRFIVPSIFPEALAVSVMGGVSGGGLAIIVWWMFFSRAPRFERWSAVPLMIIALVATRPFLHESIATGGQGYLFYLNAVPVLCLALVVWAVASRRLSAGLRRAAMVATILVASGIWTLIRTGGITTSADSDFAWRWSMTPEEQLLAQAGDESMALAPAPAEVETGADWPGFLGPERDGIIHNVRIDTDWSASPPVELWRRPVGPGWSSFAVRNHLFYTQEQRGDDEVVACYQLTTGKPVWRHSDPARFWESNGGAGPRGTPTLSDGHIYTFGGTGILNVLDANDGTVMWSRNAASDAETKLPYWGFSSSPLVVDDLVIVAASGTLAAYDIATGDPRWFGPVGSGESYSSPHLLTIDGVKQILLLIGAGVISVSPADGTLLWEHQWPGSPYLQPVLTADGDILISISENSGIRRITVSHGTDGWTIEEHWTSRRLKPFYSEFFLHEGHVFGFDRGILTCIEVEEGKRKWKGGRYGAGQLFLLADQGLLLVLSEKGELVLVKAAPDQFTELAKFPAIKGKTWNHPVLAGDILLVRNGQEMVAFRLSLAGI